MMDSMESSCVPPGFRFHPTDEELVGYYLRKKVASQKIDLDVIRDIDLYRIEPWDLQDKCRIGYEEQNEWYFFSHKDKKYPTGTRTNRATIAGFWKATGRDKAVYDKSKLIGMRKTLVFYKGRAPNGQKTDWIMHEYRLESDENGPPQEEGWVVCRAFKKRTTGQAKAIESWESSSYFYDEASVVSSSVMDNPILDYVITRRQPTNFLAQNFICKQEIESESINNFLKHSSSSSSSDPLFGQLPQLESPSMPLEKRQSSVSLLVSATDNISTPELVEEDDHQHIFKGVGGSISVGGGGKTNVTDWRALDKFVASQLSHGDDLYDGNTVSSFGPNEDDNGTDDMGLLLLQSGREEGSKFSDFLSSTSDCDIGICVFDK